MKKKSNTRKLLIVLIVVFSVLLVALLGLAFVLGRGNQDVPEETNPTTEIPQAETTQPTEAPETEAPTEAETTVPEDVTITTKFGDHVYPGVWADHVRTEITEAAIGGHVTYYGKINDKEEALFTIYYGKGSPSSQKIGTMKVDGLSLTVSVEMHDFQPDDTWTQEEIDAICAMQEGMNDVIEHLKQDPGFSAAIGSVSTEPTKPSQGEEKNPDVEDPTEEPTEVVDVEDVVVSTPCGDLFFPGQWEGQIRAEVKEEGIGYTVTFYGKIGDAECALFTVLFAADSENSFPVGVITVDEVSMDVSIELYDLEENTAWTQAQMDTASAMQEGVNYVIEKLKENPAFAPA